MNEKWIGIMIAICPPLSRHKHEIRHVSTTVNYPKRFKSMGGWGEERTLGMSSKSFINISRAYVHHRTTGSATVNILKFS
jgi:hypothetical protein